MIEILAAALAGLALLAAAGVAYGAYKLHKLTQKIQSGEYGDSVKWADELMKEDEEFKKAVKNSPAPVLMTLAELADDKEQLRRLVVEWYDPDRKS